MIYLGSTKEFENMKKTIKEHLEQLNLPYVDLGEEEVFKISKKVTEHVLQDFNYNKGIIIDGTGSAPFMVATKHKNIICAQLNDEHSGLMTRDHNNANVITLGGQLIGKEVAKSIVGRFVTHDYAGGRHQIRVDMLNVMIGENND